MDVHRISEALTNYLWPQTFPVAIKLTNSERDIPQKARMPKRDLKISMPVCQVISIVRRLGWIMATGIEDMLCPLGALTLGFLPAKEEFLDGSFNIPFWVKSQEVRAKLCRNLPRLEYKKFSYLVAAPFERADFEPQVLIIYGNPAQISRLVQSAVYMTGAPVSSDSAGGFACGAEITVPMLTDTCQVVLTGGGDRAVAQTQDHEVAFAVPAAKIDDLAEGLEQTHKAGMRYPTPSFLLYEAQFPPDFAHLMEYLKKE